MEKKKRWTIIGVIAGTVLVAAAAIVAILPLNGGRPAGQYVSADQAYRYGNETVYTVFANKDGEYEFEVEGRARQVEKVLINGIDTGLALSGGKATAALHKGINSITLVTSTDAASSKVTGLAVRNCPDYPTVGAFLTYTSYEAEEGTVNGTVTEDKRDYRSFESEASGRLFAGLRKEGEQVTVTLTAPANALVIRYCVPDSKDGKGMVGNVLLTVGGDSRQVTLSSQNSWVYGAYPWNNDPSTAGDGGPHFFYDDVRVILDRVYPAGTEVTITKEADFNYCIIDLIEGEKIGAPVQQPENSLSIVDFGAVPGDGIDDSTAIMNCIAEAVKQGKEIYMPVGEFDIRELAFVQGLPIREDNVTIRGAGMWYTILRGEAAGFNIQASHAHFYDFSLLGNVKQRKNSIDPPAFNLQNANTGAKDIRLQNIWIEHYKVGLWADLVDGISVMGCRIRNTYADGINLCAGTSNCVIIHNDIRNTGDDAVAMFNRGVLDENNKVLNNTIALPWLANHIALYGGKNILIKNNLLKDSIAFGAGINISTNFNPQVFEGDIEVEGNYLLRCGSREWNIMADYGAIWVNTVEGYDNTKAHIAVHNNVIADSTYQGISFFNSGTVENIEFTDNIIKDSGTWGLQIGTDARGWTVFKDNDISGSGQGEIENNSMNGFEVLDKAKSPVV